MKQQSIEELERELNALSPKQAKETLEGMEALAEQAKPATGQNINEVPLEEYLDFTKFPITQDERKSFERAVLDSRRRYALYSDPDPDDIEAFATSDRKVKRILYWLRK